MKDNGKLEALLHNLSLANADLDIASLLDK